jgi:PAS domain S-box-containing protein
MRGRSLTGKVVNTIPSNDVVLRRVVDRVTAAAQPDTADDLAARLRPLYPRIAVFERQLSGERAQFYVYRDGRYEPERRDHWWERTAVPCVHVDVETGRLTAVSGEWAALMRAEQAELVGRHFVDFALPEAREAAEAMFEAVSQFREVRSEAQVLRADGTTIQIEFHAVRRDGQVEVCYRPLD